MHEISIKMPYSTFMKWYIYILLKDLCAILFLLLMNGRCDKTDFFHYQSHKSMQCGMLMSIIHDAYTINILLSHVVNVMTKTETLRQPSLKAFGQKMSHGIVFAVYQEQSKVQKTWITCLANTTSLYTLLLLFYQKGPLRD